MTPLERRLTAENEALRDELTRLHDALGISADQLRKARLQETLRLRPMVTELLLVLYGAKGALRTREVIDAVLPRTTAPGQDRSLKTLDVYASYARAAIGWDGIETVWGLGYRLTPAGLARVRRALGEDQAAAA